MSAQDWLNLLGLAMQYGPGLVGAGLAVYGAWKVSGIKGALTMGLQRVQQLQHDSGLSDAEKKAVATAHLQELLPSGFKQFAPLTVELLHKEVKSAETLLLQKQAITAKDLAQPLIETAVAAITSAASPKPPIPAAVADAGPKGG